MSALQGHSEEYRRYWVKTKTGATGRAVVYEGIIVEISEHLVELLGKDWYTVMCELKDFSLLD